MVCVMYGSCEVLIQEIKYMWSLYWISCHYHYRNHYYYYQHFAIFML